MLDALGLELDQVVSCLVRAEDQTQVLRKNGQYFQPLSHGSSHTCLFMWAFGI